MNEIKAVLFDVDGVLIDSLNANSIFFERVFKAIGLSDRYSKKLYLKNSHMTMWDIIKFFSNEKSRHELNKMWVVARKTAPPDEEIAVDKDIKQVLFKLSRHYKLAAVTNRTRRGTKRVFKLFGFNKFFKTVVAYEDFKKPKPHPEPLLIALKKLKVKPSEAVYIGDTDADVQSANAAGVVSIFFSKKKNKKADYNIKSFKQLFDVIKEISEIADRSKVQ